MCLPPCLQVLSLSKELTQEKTFPISLFYTHHHKMVNLSILNIHTCTNSAECCVRSFLLLFTEFFWLSGILTLARLLLCIYGIHKCMYYFSFLLSCIILHSISTTFTAFLAVIVTWFCALYIMWFFILFYYDIQICIYFEWIASGIVVHDSAFSSSIVPYTAPETFYF